jgi:hypothetical protein
LNKKAKDITKTKKAEGGRYSPSLSGYGVKSTERKQKELNQLDFAFPKRIISRAKRTKNNWLKRKER